MPTKSARYVPRCELCDGVQNDVNVLTDMWSDGTPAPIRICSSQGCWDEANARGYLSSQQRAERASE